VNLASHLLAHDTIRLQAVAAAWKAAGAWRSAGLPVKVFIAIRAAAARALKARITELWS